MTALRDGGQIRDLPRLVQIIIGRDGAKMSCYYCQASREMPNLARLGWPDISCSSVVNRSSE